MSLGSSSELFFAGTPGGAGYEIERSLRFNSADTAYLSRTPASAGNRRTFTWAGWVKRSKLGLDGCRLFVAEASGSDIFLIRILSSDVLNIVYYNGTNYGFLTLPVYRDVSSWYHIAVSVDTTEATASDRFKLYVNGSRVTSLTNLGDIPLNTDLPVNNTVSHAIGNGGGSYYDGYLADIHFIDGQALDPTSFGEFDDNGIWQPIRYAGTYGTNGFHLPFSDNSTAAALGTDTSGNGNTWTVNNISVAAGAGNDSLVDVPTNGTQTDTGVGGEVRGNYATLNPLAKNSTVTLSNGNLDFTGDFSGSGGAIGTIAVSSGKWYWEIIFTTVAGGALGIAKLPLSDYAANTTGTYIYLPNGNKRINLTDSAYGAAYTDNDIIGVALDLDAGTVTFYKNNVSQGTAFSGLTGDFTVWLQDGSSFNTPVGFINFGQRPFAYTAPSGYKALCTANLQAPTIEDGSTVMDVALYTGNGSTQSISGLAFSPDFVWIKNRTSSFSHALWDVVRGATKELNSNGTGAEGTVSTGLTSFDATGFSLGSNSGVNNNTNGFVAWTWDAGSSTVTNNNGSISSQVRANPSAGFSIVTYTGTGVSASIGHGLNALPQMIIVKSRSATGNWAVYHRTLGANTYLYLNATDAAAATSNYWQYTSSPGNPTTAWFGTLGGNDPNISGVTYVAYCFASVAGYSAFGSYTGNGSTDGPFVYTGFRPAFVIVKNSTVGGSGYSWYMWDSKRPGYNWQGGELFADQPNAEDTGFERFDILSNGFKLRSAGAAIHGSGSTMLSAVFAQHPFSIAPAR
jgi:hypothetical protein